MAQRRPVLEQFNLVVSDMAASIAFCEAVGVAFEPSPAEWAPHHRSAVSEEGLDFDLESPEFAAVRNQRLAPSARASHVGRRRDRIPGSPAGKTSTRCISPWSRLGALPGRAPYDTFRGARYAIVEDPDGNAVGLMSPSDPERRQPPPAPDWWASSTP